MPLSPPFLVVEMAAGASVEKLRALIPADVFPEHALISGRLVFGRQETLQRVQKLSKQDQTELKGAFKAVEGAPLQVVAQLPPDVRRVVRELGGQPIPELGIGRVDELGAAFRWMAIGVDVAPRFSLRGALQADSPEGLERLRTAIQSAVRAGLAQPDLRVVAPAVNQLSSQLKLTAEDSRLRFDLSGDETTATLRDALVGPIMQARRSAQRAQSTNNLRQIALAFHNYHDTYRAFPPAASLSKDGKPLLSWRVHLLPFLDQGELYRQFKLDESWDSPHNRALIAKIPPVYVAPGLDAAAREGKTVYVVPVGEKSVFSTPRGTRIANITDGTSNTILALQSPAERAVVWTQPADWEFNPERPKEGVFLPGVADLVAALCDGSVRVISAQVAADVWRNLVQMNDGQVVGEF